MASALRRSDSDVGEPDAPPSIRFTRARRLIFEGTFIVFAALLGVAGLFGHDPHRDRVIYTGFGCAAIMLGFFLYSLRERPKD
jgi:hypothetical protein